MGWSKRLTRWMFRAWPAILVGTLALSALSIRPSIRLFKNISTDPVDLLPKRDPNALTLLSVRDKLSGGARASFVIESNNRAANIRALEDLASALRGLPFIRSVEPKKPGYDFFDQSKLLFMDKADLAKIRDRLDARIRKEKLKSTGLFIDFTDDESEAGEEDVDFSDLETKYKKGYSSDVESPYNESADGRVFVLWTESAEEYRGIASASRFQDQLHPILENFDPSKYDPSMKVFLSGSTKTFEYRALMKDLALVGLISGVLIFLPLLSRFRNLFHVAWVFLPLIVAMPISFAVSSFFVAKLNITTSFLFAILGGLGIENGIHIFTRYREGRASGQSVEDAVEEIFSHTGRAVLTAVASVAVTFFALVWNDFRGFSEFGIISGTGLWVIFLVYFTFMPALLIFLEKIGGIRSKTGKEPSFGVSRLPAWSFGAFVAIGCLFTVFSLFAAPRVQFEYDSRKTRADIPEVREIQAKRRLTNKRVNSPAVVVIHSKAEADELRALVDKIAKEDRTFPTVSQTKSYYDLIPADQTEKMAIVRQIRRLLEDRSIRFVKKEKRKDLDRFREAVEKTRPVVEANIPPEILRVFRGNGATEGELFYINAIEHLELDDGRNARAFAHDIGKLETTFGTIYPSSDSIIFGKVLETMLRDAPKVMVISILLIAFFVFLDFRSFRKTAIVMSSILLGVLWMFGAMWLWDVRLNFYNMIIIPAVLGMSIDNSIHIYHRYQELGRGSIPQVVATSGLAALLASLTNASAFIGLLFCMHKGLLSIGLLAVIGASTCLFSTLVFFPAALAVMEKIVPAHSSRDKAA